MQHFFLLLLMLLVLTVVGVGVVAAAAAAAAAVVAVVVNKGLESRQYCQIAACRRVQHSRNFVTNVL